MLAHGIIPVPGSRRDWLLQSVLGVPLLVVLAAGLAVLLWGLLFLIKDQGLLPWVNPFARHPVVVIGISYMVFRCIQFVMDGEALEGADFPSFLNFVFFFPTLLAVRRAVPQLGHDRHHPDGPERAGRAAGGVGFVR